MISMEEFHAEVEARIREAVSNQMGTRIQHMVRMEVDNIFRRAVLAALEEKGFVQDIKERAKATAERMMKKHAEKYDLTEYTMQRLRKEFDDAAEWKAREYIRKQAEERATKYIDILTGKFFTKDSKPGS